MLSAIFADILARHADRTALSDPEQTFTYRGLDQAAAEVAALLEPRVGAAPGARVGVLAANSAGYVVWYLALLRLGAVPFLMDAALGPGEVAAVAEDCSLDLLVHDARDLGALAGVPVGEAYGLHATPLHPGVQRRYPLHPETEVCRFTSGSTGKPNCIEFSGDAVARAAANWTAGSGLHAEDRIACFAALSNGLAFNTSLLAAFGPGASLHLTRGLPTGAHIARMLERTRASWLVGFPALYESVVRRALGGAVFGRVRIAISSGAPLRPETRRAFAALAGVPVSNYYGVAETGPLTFTPAPDADGGLGVLLPGVELAAGDAPDRPAEIRVRSQSMGTRYLNAPGVFEDRIGGDGRYRTGDEGYLRAGELFLTGRTGRMINFGGRKIDPVEVGNVLRRLAGVRDAVVFEVPDKHGEPAVAAAVVPEPDAVLDADALRAHCGGELAAYKVPGFFRLVEEIPANSIGKPSLEKLRSLVAPAAARDERTPTA
jgi:acyl-CoA synthetase (AMP-forming)/AMP-acid ligase II